MALLKQMQERRTRRHIPAYVLLENLEPWTGPVVRREPTTYQRPSEILIRMCANIYCRHWTPTRLPECVVCHTAHEPSIPSTAGTHGAPLPL